MVFSRAFSIGVFILFLAAGQSQTVLRGNVSDAATGEKLPFASISFVKNRSIGTQSDAEGQFSIKLKGTAVGDSLRAGCVGFLPQTFPIAASRPEQVFDIKLKPNTAQLAEATITADPDPGKTLMKKVIARNSANDPARFARLDARRWTRSEVATFDPKLAADPTGKLAAQSRGLLSSRVRAFEKNAPAGDTLRGETPLFFMEKLADYSRSNRPFGEIERVTAVKSTNLQTDRALENLARWDPASVNLYAPRAELFGRAFVSPIGRDALGFYDFYIEDSTAAGNGFHKIRLQAIPKTWHGNVFTGFFTIEDSSYALTSADLRLSKSANLNFIESLAIHQEFAPAMDFISQKTALAPRESSIAIKYEAGLELLGIPLPPSADSRGIVARISAVYGDVRVNVPPEASGPIGGGGLVRASHFRDSGESDLFWEKHRPDTLTARQTATYNMAAELRADPKQRAKDKFLATLADGAYSFGNNWRLGPVGSTISTNQNEGVRIRAGFRTMEGVSKKNSVFGHLAYGTGDGVLKGGLGLRHLASVQPYRKTELVASRDYEVLSNWYDEPDGDNLANSIFRKNVPFNRTFVSKIALSHDRQVAGNFIVHGGLTLKSINPAFDLPFVNPDFLSQLLTPNEPQTEKSLTAAEASIGLRFAWREASKIHNYQREPITSRFPTAALAYSRGIKKGPGEFGFQKIEAVVGHKTRLTPKAMLIWNIEAGKVFGTLPTLLLHVPQGNDAYVMSRHAFNTMSPYEFSTDRWAGLHSRLALGGMLFDRVPLLQKLGWRERLTFNALWGDLSEKNRAFNQPQSPVAPNGRPFMEAGAGVENIFHLFSIDVLRRLNYLDSPSAAVGRTGVYFGMKVFF